MRMKIGAAVAASCVLLSPTMAGASTIVMGSSYAHDCSVQVIRGLSDNETLLMCSTALDVDPLTAPDRAKTLVNRGVLQLRRDNLTDAMSDLDRAEKIGPDLAEIYVNRGVALIRRKQYVQAIPQLDRGISMGADELEKAYYDRGIAKEESGDIKGAYFDYVKASALKPDWDAPKKELTRFVVQKPGA
jgi:tetratricopeptide (TPR) repeat protein